MEDLRALSDDTRTRDKKKFRLLSLGDDQGLDFCLDALFEIC